MSPLRILILIILFYIGYRLMFGGRKKDTGKIKDRTGQSTDMPASDILEEDPVCGKLVPRQQAVEYEQNGKVVYFCSQECCKQYRDKTGE